MRLMALARRHPRAQVILSGPGPAEEEVLRRAPELEGRLVIDRRARNTFENAFYSLGLAQPGPQERWLVVTSAVHRPRSMGAFSAIGFKVEPLPVSDTPIQAAPAAPMVQCWGSSIAGFWGEPRSCFPACPFEGLRDRRARITMLSPEVVDRTWPSRRGRASTACAQFFGPEPIG